jgi:hypothetical protein
VKSGFKGAAMAFSCFAAMAVFCFSLQEQMNLGKADVPALEQVSSAGWHFVVDEKAKLRKPRRPETPFQACNGSDCILYWRRCDDAAQPKQCDFFVEVGAQVHSLTLVADDEARARAAIASAAVLTTLMGGNTLPPVIPLTELNQETPP